MSLPIPVLDDKRFEELFEEARSLIPRYAPEWSDHNFSDPGITLLDLFAWLSEMQIYSLDRITDRHIVKFLRLLHTLPRPAQTAAVDLTFELEPRRPEPTPVYEGTQVAGFDRLTGDERIFEVGRDRRYDRFVHYRLNQSSVSNLLAAGIPADVVDLLDLLVDPGTVGGDTRTIFERRLAEVLDGQQMRLYGDVIADEARISLFVTHLAVQRVLTLEESRWRDQSDPNGRAGVYYFAFGESPSSGNVLYLGFDADFEFPTVEILLTVSLYEADLPDLPDEWDNTYVDRIPSASIVWEYWNGTAWMTLDVEDGTIGFLQSGLIGFAGPDDIAAGAPEQAGETLYWIRARILTADFEIPPRVDEIRTNTVPASHGETVRNEFPERIDRVSLLLDADHSSGLPFQTFRLQKAPVVAGSTVVDVKEEDDRWHRWEAVSDFDRSTPQDRHYMVDLNEGIVAFGDGINARIPPQGLRRVRVVKYRVGGGEVGNVKAATLTQILSSQIPDVTVTNSRRAAGGAEAESLPDGAPQDRARRDLKHRYRTITSEDFEKLTLSIPGLRLQRAKVLPLYHPALADVPIPGAVTVVVVPHILDPEGERLPAPSKGLLETVHRHLDRRRLMTTDLHVVGPEFVQVSVTAVIQSGARVSDAEVRANVLDRLRTYLNPSTGGDSATGWPFGRPVYRSDILQQVESVSGVSCVNRLEISVLGCSDQAGDRRPLPADEEGNVQIPRTALTYSGQHSIELTAENGQKRV